MCSDYTCESKAQQSSAVLNSAARPQADCSLFFFTACRKNVKDSNVVGEASILGGLLVVKAEDAGIAWMHAEKTFGEFPDTQDVIAAAKAAVGAAQ
jgi:hypothetical protein